MTPILKNLTKDITKINLADICSCWQWCLKDQKSVILISNVGDMFLTGEDGSINWLDTGTGRVNKIANNLRDFELLLCDQANIDYWILTNIVEQLKFSGKVLNENEVYSLKIPPSLGGDYTVDNFESTDISVHFAIYGQIHEQIKDLPDGIKINRVDFQK